MARREFTFSEGTSNKFWAIELDGKKHTVHFGRIGTAGQAQTKEFSSEDEAKRSYEKLIAEKVKKGYTEVSSGTKSATPAAKAVTGRKKNEPDSAAGTQMVGESPEDNESPSIASALEAEPKKAVSPSISRTIELNPQDWFWVTWRRHAPPPRPEPAPFNLQDCLKRVRNLTVDQYGWVPWAKARIPVLVSRQEAHFWFLALAENAEKCKPAEVADKLAKQDFSGSLSLQQAKKRLKGNPRLACAWAVQKLFYLLPSDQIFELLDDSDILGDHWNVPTEALMHFTSEVFPYLSNEELAGLKKRLRSLDPAQWPVSDYYKRPPMTFYLAALVGVHDELLALVKTWADDLYQKSGWDHTYYHEPQRIVFGLANPRLVESEMRRLRLPLRRPDFMRAWLALTELSALDFARDNILAETKKEKCEELLQVFALVKAPEAAPHMLELKLSSKAPGVARQWLDEEVGNAVAGLVPVAAGRGKLAEAAVEYLLEKKQQGFEKLIRDCLKDQPAEVADKVRAQVLDRVEVLHEEFDAKTTPLWLRQRLEEIEGKPAKLPGWVASAVLPPVLVNQRRLNAEQVQTLLGALQKGSFESEAPLVFALKEYADPDSLDRFAWKLFELWLGEGAPSKEKWAMGAVGHFGGDASVLKLTPLIRNWPGESQHQRAVFGLECLRAVGSDTALMALNGIAQKLKFKGLKQKATQLMEEIAHEMGLTKAQLEDRIVPDCDLDERGRRLFDFGPRQFHFALGPEMKPMVKDPDGKLKPDLPKPGAKDDARKAAEAVAAWKLMKKQIKEVATIQAQRLEQAMVTGRRWTVQDFETLLVKHPLMTNLVRLVLWAGCDQAGKLVSTFRVTEDQTYADAKDEAYTLKGIESVGIVHPLHLTDEQKSAWGEVFSDYEIVPPFAQLGRTIYRLEKDEEKATELTRFKGIKLPAPSLVFTLEKLGWLRGTAMDAGCFDEHSKQFQVADVTAVVHYEGTVGMGYIDPNEELTMNTCCFVRGLRAPSGYSWNQENKLKLGEVDPVALSEVLTDLTALAAKGK